MSHLIDRHPHHNQVQLLLCHPHHFHFLLAQCDQRNLVKICDNVFSIQCLTGRNVIYLTGYKEAAKNLCCHKNHTNLWCLQLVFVGELGRVAQEWH